MEPRAHKYWREWTGCGQCDLKRLMDPRIVVSTCERILDEHVYEAEGVGEKKDDEKGACIARKSLRRSRMLEEKMMRSGSRMITDGVSRKGRGKHRRGIINEAAGPQQPVGDCDESCTEPD